LSCGQIAEVLANLLRFDSHESYPKYLGKENSAPKEQLRPSTADSSSKLQRTVMQESMRRIDIHASSAKERSYQYKV
jgi:hypothetical protein